MRGLRCILLIIAAMLVICTGVSAESAPGKIPPVRKEASGGQIIVVEAARGSSFKGTLSLREKLNGEWKTTLSGIPVVLGKNGIGKLREGDGKTPTGTFPIGHAFGTAAKPAGLKLTYALAGKQDYWVDDAASADYNKWVHYAGNPASRWKSFERLYIPQYKYAVVIRYNDNPIVKGKGSAIFMHIWRSQDKPTAGCVAMSEGNLLKLMGKLDPKQSPVITITRRQ
ncbi:L,D-transpeptidase family protein [Paenibacillus sp. YPG26]|uniref:L,D-transpeptidase family protein n=1 Tax=Paenibacillus sp. YPG26 TaxID=2878915 RepID=UPI00203CAE06|nr:L,D-transpeptidase family protein [Paenibacillus sp. YPG26]USB33061.1 L,D-transpeptidase family protein [Paenibacillus sp. YPG26]